MPRHDDAALARRAQAFWQGRQRRAGVAGYSGYLLDGSPACIGERRFEGEWRDLQTFLKALPARGACLDVGCGTGLWLERFAGIFGRAEGWDYAPAMARAAKARLKACGRKNAVVRCGEVHRRAGRHAFDLIFVGGVLMYTPESRLGPLLAALRRLLKPDGLLLLRESTQAGPAWRREGLPLRPGLLARGRPSDEDYVAVYRSRQALRAALQGAGFAVAQEAVNRHYKLSDLTEDWLRRLDRLGGGRLGRDAALCERWARRVFAWRWALLYPEYLLRRFKLQNRWFVCQRRSST